MWSDLSLGSLLQGQMSIATLKVLITHLLLVLEVCNIKKHNVIMAWKSLFTYSHKYFSISYKIANCRDALYKNLLSSLYSVFPVKQV